MHKDYRQALIAAVYADLPELPEYVADDPLAKDAANVINRLRDALRPPEPPPDHEAREELRQDVEMCVCGYPKSNSPDEHAFGCMWVRELRRRRAGPSA